MRKIFYIIVLLFVLTSCHHIDQTKKIQKGVLDLRDADLENPLFLEGEWIFFRNEFVKPSEVFNRDTLFYTTKLTWDNSQIPVFGYGTYACRIIVPKGIYSLKIIRIETAYQLFVNNKLLEKVGQVSKKAQDEIPKFKPQVLTFKTHSDTIDLVFWISNHNFRVGGFMDKVMFGKSNAVLRETWAYIGMQIFIIGVIMILITLNFWLYFFRRKELSALYFSLLILIQMIYELTNNEVLILHIFPNMSWNVFVRIDFLSNYLRFSFLILFLYETFKTDFPKLLKYIAYTGFAFALTVILPVKIFSFWLPYFIVIVMFTMLWTTIALFYKSLKTKDQLYIFGAIGTFSIILLAVLDTIYSFGIYTKFNFANIGAILYLIAFTYLNSRNLAQLETYATSTRQNIEILNKIREKLLQIPSFDLEKIIEAFAEEINAKHVRLYIDTELIVSIGDENLFFENILKKQNKKDSKFIFKKIKRKLSIAITNFNLDNQQLSLYTAGELSKNSLEIINIFSGQLRTFVENYKYYNELLELNKNLEKIVEERTILAMKQRDELQKKNIELDEYLESLTFTTNIITELNEDLKQEKAEVEKKNKLLLEQKASIEKQRNKILEYNKIIEASINYAKRIQNALFSAYHSLEFEHAVFDKPIAEIGGDFWWTYKHQNKQIIIVGDCTGHNVAGAFMTVVLHDIIKRTINELIKKQQKLTPQNIISKTGEIFTEIFKNTLEENFVISVAVLENHRMLTFGGFGQDMIIFRNGEAMFLNGTQAIPGIDLPVNIKLEGYNINLKPNDKIYLFTDGFYKQQGQKGQYGKKRFKELIAKIGNMSFNAQIPYLEKELFHWKEHYKQTDDILILMIKI